MTAFRTRAAEIGVRAGKTFMQAGLASLAASATGVYSIASWKAAVTAGIAATISLAQNAFSKSEEHQAKAAAERAYRSRVTIAP